MAYRFRLETLLSVRRTREEQAQLAMAKEQRLLDELIDRLERLGEQRQRTIDDLEKRKHSRMSAPLFSLYLDGIWQIDLTIARQKDSIASQRQVLERFRQKVIAAVRDRKVMERLKEKDREAYLQEEIRRELAINDEQALLVFGRQDNLLNGSSSGS